MRLPFPQRVAAMDSCEALFAPDFYAQHDRLSDLSYAYYSFDLTSYSGEETLQLHWLNGVPAGKVWLGLPDWSSNLWQWFAVPASGIISTPFAGWTKDEQLLALIVTVGDQQLWLRQINLGTLDSWSHSFGGPAYDTVEKVFVDTADNVYAAGETASFTGGTTAALIVKYSPAGALLWARTVSLPGQNLYVRDWAASPDGTVAGLLSQKWEQPPGTQNDGMLVFTVTPSGGLGWSKLWQLPLTNYASGIGAFPDGSFAVTCVLDADNPDPLQVDGAVLRLTPAGEFQEANAVDLGGRDSFFDFHQRPGDGALLAGFGSYPPDPAPNFRGTLELPPTNGLGLATLLPQAAIGSDGTLLSAVTITETADIFSDDLSLAHWDASGALLWAVRFNFDSNEDAWNAAFAPAGGDCFLVGRTHVAGRESPVFARFNSSGSLQNAQTWCPGGECYTLAFDSQANAVVGLTGATDARGIWKPFAPTVTAYTPEPVAATGIAYTPRALTYPLADGTAVIGTPTGAVTDLGGGDDDLLVIKRDSTEL